MSTINSISVCIIYANRKEHLYNAIAGLNYNSSFSELVVVTMNDELPSLPETSFTIKTANITTENGFLPLAAARNKCAEIATGENLVFLDVDCIAHPNLIEVFEHHLIKQDALYQGSVRYLTSDWQRQDWTYESLRKQSVVNKLQGEEVSQNHKQTHPYELFWSLCFGIRKKTFARLGGFDPGFRGYGAEDTDFSFTARSHSLPLYKVSALCYHQFHPSYNPPLNHLAEIVSNAQVFYRKWGTLPMDKWLKQFADKGYITLKNNAIEIIKYPSSAEISACMKQH